MKLAVTYVRYGLPPQPILDDPSPYQATEHMGVESRLANVNIVGDLPCRRADDDDQIRAARELEA